MRISEKLKDKKIIVGVATAAAIVVFATFQNNSIITRQKLKEYKSLDKKIQELEEKDSKYYSDNSEEISKYLDLRVKYEDMEQSFNEYKEKYPNDLAEEIETAKEEVNEYYSKAMKLEHELKEAKAEKQESQLASSNYSSSSSGSSSQGSYNYSQSNNNSSSNRHIGKSVYIANGNSYYHKSPSCKFLRGASVKAVGINNVGGKHACNCVKY